MPSGIPYTNKCERRKARIVTKAKASAKYRGKIKKLKEPRISSEEIFWTKVDKSPGLGPNGDCWEWIGHRDKIGYGKIKRRTIGIHLAHRYAYILTYGKITNFCCHRCDNPPCVKPDHLFEGTNKENMIDASKKGRLYSPKGEKSPKAKLNKIAILVAKYYHERGYTFRRIAKAYKVNDTTISRAIYGTCYGP